ncbi:MAG: cyclic nucleotide-binding domain-containing protein [Pseudomonadota bacterium]
MNKRIARVTWSIAAALGITALALIAPGVGGLDSVAGRGVEILMWLLGAVLLHHLLVLVLWEGLVPRWSGGQMPKLVSQITGVVLFAIAVSAILVRVLEVPVAGVLTTSGLFIAIIGFALRNMISDLFTGIALGLERPFAMGDWIQVADGTVGQVTEINWRSTRLITREEITVVIPNSELAISTFKNFSQPARFWRDHFEILLNHAVTPHQAERILLSAINQVPELARLDKQPEVRIDRYTENGVIWSIRYWVPDYPEMSRLRYEVQKAVSRNLYYAGLTIPGERIELAPKEVMQQPGSRGFLRHISLFDVLADHEIEQLEASMTRQLMLKGQDVVKQGAPGSSLFVTREGLLQVIIQAQGDDEVTVAHLVPGAFFGEMSLLTGDPRGATVRAVVDSIVFEIRKQDFEPLLRARPELAATLSRTLAERIASNLARDTRHTGPHEVDQGGRRILEKMRRFFTLGEPEKRTGGI